jgi:hypothetical protein
VTEPVTVLQRIEAALQRACSFDPNDRLAPAALLWADRQSEWLPVITRLANGLPIFTLGDYDGERTGPAIWMRCVIDRSLGDVPAEAVPVVYIPGYDRSDLRAIEECPAELQPLAELQYRGVFFGSRAGRDWTTTAFFSNRDEGLGIEIGRDADTEAAFTGVLPLLLDESVWSLRQKAPLRAADLGALLNPDPVRTLLRWLDDPASLESLDGAARKEFARVAEEDFGFSPQDDGPFAAAAHLGGRSGSWNTAWERFSENPSGYPGVSKLLRQARPVEVLVPDHPGSWPQDNEDGEQAVRSALYGLADSPVEDVRAAVRRLEAEHRERREWVWATLGQAPLAGALQHLGVLAEESEKPLAGETPVEIAEVYATRGWRADEATLLAMSAAGASPDRQAVEAIVAALYRPWADACARRFQEAVIAEGATQFGRDSALPGVGECVLFTDGLRFDLGARLKQRLKELGVESELGWQFAAIPSLTATAKPAVSPAASRLTGGEAFGTVVADTGQAVTADLLRKTISAEGITVIVNGALADPNASGWTEFGNVDAIGHSQTDRFAQDVAGHVRDIADRALALLEAGWLTVRVVTDHGWLYVPSGLEKVGLPEHLTVTRKGRAARLKDDAGAVEYPVVPWRWDSDVRVAVSPGISCYVANRVYEHGGLSPQECVVPVLTIRAGQTALGAISIEDASWTGLRLRLRAEGARPGLVADLRTKAGDAETSVVLSGGQVEADGSATLLVSDERAGEAAVIVLFDQDGTLVGQRHTTVGGE